MLTYHQYFDSLNALNPDFSVFLLRSDVSFYEEKLDSARGGQEVSEIEQELGEILRDVNDASLKLRLARAERDEASNRVSALEECNWALLSEFEAVRDFEGEEI